MFRSLSQDAVDENANGNVGASAPFGAGRRRTRAQAKLEINERREQLKRTREAMEAMSKTRAKLCSKLSTPPRAANSKKVKIKVGASFGDNLTVEHTPTKKDPSSPPALRRANVTDVGVGASPTTPNKLASSNKSQQPLETNEDEMTTVTSGRRVMAARGIAQSSSSGTHGSSRKRMISFSPERAERPINEEAERLKCQRNLKATEKLQLRLEGMPTRTPEKPVHPSSLARKSSPPQLSALQTPTKSTPQKPLPTNSVPTQPTPTKPTPTKPTPSKPTPQKPRPQKQTPTARNQQASPTTASGSQAGEVPVAPSPPLLASAAPLLPRSDTPNSQASDATLELPSGPDANNERVPSRTESVAASVRCKKELDFTAAEDADVHMETASAEQPPPDREEDAAAREEPAVSQPDVEMLSQPSETPMEASAAEEDGEQNNSGDEPPATAETPPESGATPTSPQHSIGFGCITDSSTLFTSTSTIEDVGLFNCETDVEFTGGVYGEGTDGKVSAAMVRGQKVALKRAKPHDGFPEEEAKRRSAIELHYLRRVRHVAGFVQCLGLCDGIEHTCIALEVMDCKLSDYLRRYGRQHRASGASASSKRRCFTLSLDATKGMLKQICQPMMELHDHVNVAHGDLACRNILLRLPPKGYEMKWEPVVKLSDFGRIKTPASEPPIFGDNFSFHKNYDVGSFAREILYRLLVGEIVPTNCTETRNLHKHLQDVVVVRVPDAAKEKLGPYYRLFMRCAGWGVRPSFREIVDHLDDLEYFETSDNGYFPLKPSSTATTTPSTLDAASFLSPMMESGRHKAPSSGSKNKYETPVTATSCGVPATAPAHGTGSGVRLLPSKSFTDGPQTASQQAAGTTTTMKTVNWLKARSVHPGQGGPHGPKIHMRPANSANNATTASVNLAGTSTPNGRPAMPKKTPPSAGASRRSLQILTQIQHRIALTEKEKKKR